MPYPKPFCWFTKDSDASPVAHRVKMLITAKEVLDRDLLIVIGKILGQEEVQVTVCVDEVDAFELHSGLDVISQIVFGIPGASRGWVDRAVVGTDLACASPETRR